ALEHRGVRYAAVDLKHGAFSDADAPLAPLYFNQASPSAYVRGNTRAVPYALAYIRALEIRGVRVLNGSAAFSLELSKTAQAALLRELDVPTPRVWTFNDVEALRARAGKYGSRCCSSRSRAAAARASCWSRASPT